MSGPEARDLDLGRLRLRVENGVYELRLDSPEKVFRAGVDLHESSYPVASALHDIAGDLGRMLGDHIASILVEPPPPDAPDL